VDPEPLGGHLHFSWCDIEDVTPVTVRSLLMGLNVVHHRLVTEFFDEGQLIIRRMYADDRGRDYAKLGMFRAVAHRQGTFDQVVQAQHIEYRYPPSWMLTPEMAYVFLASGEIVARKVLIEKYTGTWRGLAMDILDFGEVLPADGAPSVKQAYEIAKRNLNWKQDFTDNWLTE